MYVIVYMLCTQGSAENQLYNEQTPCLNNLLHVQLQLCAMIAYLTNKILRNANEIHFIPCDIIVASNSFKVIHNHNEFYTAVDC